LQFLNALNKSTNSSSRGLYIDSCYAHCQTETQEKWFMEDSPVLGKKVRDCKFSPHYQSSPIVYTSVIFLLQLILLLS